MRTTRPNPQSDFRTLVQGLRPAPSREGLAEDGSPSAVWKSMDGAHSMRIRLQDGSLMLNEYDRKTSVRTVVGSASFLRIMAQQWLGKHSC